MRIPNGDNGLVSSQMICKSSEKKQKRNTKLFTLQKGETLDKDRMRTMENSQQ